MSYPTRCIECDYIQWQHGLKEYVCMYYDDDLEAVIPEPTIGPVPEWCPRKIQLKRTT